MMTSANKLRATVLLLAALLLTGRATYADAQADAAIRKVLGPHMQSCLAIGHWAMADVGTDLNSLDVVLLHRYKGVWRKQNTTGDMGYMQLLAMGVPDFTARSFGMGDVPQTMIVKLGKATRAAHLNHTNYNVVTGVSGFFAYTTANPAVTGYQIWYTIGSHWKQFFKVPSGLTPAQTDALFAKNGIPRFLEHRILYAHGSDL